MSNSVNKVFTDILFKNLNQHFDYNITLSRFTILFQSLFKQYSEIVPLKFLKEETILTSASSDYEKDFYINEQYSISREDLFIKIQIICEIKDKVIIRWCIKVDEIDILSEEQSRSIMYTLLPFDRGDALLSTLFHSSYFVAKLTSLFPELILDVHKPMYLSLSNSDTKKIPIQIV